MNMSDGIGNNNFHPNDINVSDPALGVSRSFVGQKRQHIHHHHHQQQQQQQNGRYPKGGVVDHQQEVMQQHMSPMMMNDNRSSFPTPPPQQHYRHTNSEQFVLPTFASISDDHYNNFHRQSNNNFQPEKIQMLPRGQQDRGHQQQLTRSLPIINHNNGGSLLHGNSIRPLSQSLPQFQGSISLEALRADIHRKTQELEQVEKQAGYSSSLPSSIIQPSNASLFPNSLQQQQQTNLPSKPLFHHEDPLSFCQDDKTNGHGEDISSNKKDPFAPVTVSLQQQLLPQNPEQMTTISQDNLAQISRQGAVFTALSPPPSPDSSQTKRRRLNSDQMLHLFLSDTIIESPTEVAEKKLLVPTATTTAADDSADRGSGMPSLPFFNSDGESMTSEGDEESTKLQVSDDKQSKHETIETAQEDVSEHIITPSTAAISKLTAEIRSQALMKREQTDKERSTSPSNESHDSSFEPNQGKPITTTVSAARLAKIASAMEASQTSQQNIHDWDKKFGLKRAHSKTMRESCRSRKKVLDFLKREMDESKESVLSALFEESGASSTTINCSDAVTTTLEEERDPGSLSSLSSHTSDFDEDIDMSDVEEEKDDLDVELEQMFRRASVDCVESILSVGSPLLERARQSSSSGSSGSFDKSVVDALRSSMTMPLPEEEDRVQYNAKCA